MTRDVWRAARSFAELCERGALFLEGRLSSFPGWGAAETDAETDGAAALLARANRAGFLTLASQVGSAQRAADGRAERRRAFLLGFASPALEARLRGRLGPELWVRSFGAREEGGERIAVGERGHEPFLFAGFGAGPAELEIFADWIAPAALAELAATRLVWVVEPEWDRDDRLWGRLAGALGIQGGYPPAHHEDDAP